MSTIVRLYRHRSGVRIAIPEAITITRPEGEENEHDKKWGLGLAVGMMLVFAVLAQGVHGESIQVTYPNGGEYWDVGTTQNLTWKFTGLTTRSVKIELLKGGAVNQVIHANYPIGINGNGSITWQTPYTQIDGSDYRIRVTTINNPVEISDPSDTNFSIYKTAFHLTKPVGGERFTIGTNQQIAWTSQGFKPGTKATIFAIKGTTGYSVAQGDASGSYTWSVGKINSYTLPAGNDVRICVSIIGDPKSRSSCSQPFSLVNSVLKQGIIPSTKPLPR